MEMSEQTNEIFAALAKFQGELNNANKSKQGHGYSYADLAECIDTAKPHLAANGLAVSQLLGMSQNGDTLITMMTHSSGQWFRSEFVMAKAVLQGGGGKNPAQVMGSAITYMRRYAYAAITGLAQADDDAAMVSVSKVNAQPTEQQLIDHIISKGFTVEGVCQSYQVQSVKQLTDRQAVINQVNQWSNK